MSHPQTAFTYDQLLEYTDTENEKWRRWLSDNPAALDIPFADGRMATLRGLIVHIFVVELRYAERLHGATEVTSYESVTAHSVDEIFEVGKRARALLRDYLSKMTDADAAVVLVFPTLTAGVLTASKHKIASNAFLHSIRHWAQVATVVRQAGFRTEWGHDLLLSSLEM